MWVEGSKGKVKIEREHTKLFSLLQELGREMDYISCTFLPNLGGIHYETGPRWEIIGED